MFTAVGGWLGYFLGGCDGLLIALVVFASVDYITGVMCAINDQKLSSEVGFRGICRKVLIFILVGIANILDVEVIGTGSFQFFTNTDALGWGQPTEWSIRPLTVIFRPAV